MNPPLIKSALVTGGAGFVGTHLVERLLEPTTDVRVLDDCSNGNPDWLPDEAEFIDGDCTDPDTVHSTLTPDVDTVFHLASRKAVDDDNPRTQFQENTAMTQHLIDAAIAADVDQFVFTSSSTIYGEAPMPTPEDHAPLEPISAYGASKLACEGLCSVAAHSHGLTVRNLRFANVVGPRLRGAVIPDFIAKLRDDPTELTILGDGRQEKSYLHVDDCIDAMLHVCEHAEGPMASFNIGTRSTTSVDRIAAIVADELGLDPDFTYTGGERGWTGDVPKMRLSIGKLAGLGWGPTMESDVAVRQATRELAAEL